MSAQLIAEFIGTFILVLAILLTGNPLFIASGFLAAITIAGGISGGHLNPAVSFVKYMSGDLNATQFSMYWGAQVTGALLALFVAKTLKKA